MTSSDFQKNDRCESISAACDNFLSVRFVPFSDPKLILLSVRYGEMLAIANCKIKKAKDNKPETALSKLLAKKYLVI